MSDETHYYGDGHDHAAVEGGAGPGYGPSGPEHANKRPFPARQALPLPLDLNDPVVENEVADAIRRLAPDGALVPLSTRYPWRFADPAPELSAPRIADAVVEMLQTSGLVFLVPPGRCGAPHPGEWDDRTQKVITMPVTCENRATHVGQHEGTYWPPVPGLDHGIPVAWDDVVDAQVVDDDEVLVEDTWFPRADLPDVLARHMRSLTDATRETKQLVIRLERISAIVSASEDAEDAVERRLAERLRAAFLDPDPDPS